MKNKAAIYAPILLIAVYLFLAAVRFIPGENLGMDTNPYLSVVFLQVIVYLVPIFIYMNLRGKGFFRRLRLRLPQLGHFLLILYGACLLVTCNALVSMVMYRLMPESFVSSSASDYTSFAMNSGVFDGLYLTVAFALLPAITEELLFRGIIVAEYEDYGPVFAVIFSSVTFAMSHFSVARLPVYVTSGILLALILYATRSLLASIVIHCVNNISVLFLEKYIVYIAEKQNISMVLFLIILGCLALVSLLLFCSEAGRIYRAYAEDSLTVDYGSLNQVNLFQKIGETYFSPTFLILTVIFITLSLSW